MKRAVLALILGINLSIGLMTTYDSQSLAASSPSGITVSPAFQQISIAADQSQRSIEFKITNNLAQPRTIALSTQDFNALDESGGLFFVGTNPSELEKKYGLAKWLNLPTSSVTIPPKQTVKVTILILNQPSLAPGGHYGALMLTLPTSANPNSTNKVALKSIASSLLFVNKVGGDIHRLKLRGVDDKHTIVTLPNKVILDFGNTGNTHLVPRGIVTVTDSGGKLISKGIINENSNLLLPERTRKYSVDLERISRPIKPGHYILTINYRFDGFDQFATYQRSLLLVLPLNLLAFLLFLLALLAAVFFSLKKTFRTNLIGRFKSKS